VCLRHHANAEEAGETAYEDDGDCELGEARHAISVSFHDQSGMRGG
jgi:hypothetical protein